MTDLWQHQQEAVEFALARFAEGRGVLLAHQMGCGKSRAALELVGDGVTLVLCPKAARAVWKREHEKLGSPFNLVVLDAMPLRDRVAQVDRALEVKGKPVVLVSNYESLLNDDLFARLDGLGIDLIVLDECHRLKAPNGKTSRAVARLCWRQKRTGWEPKIPRRIGLSGTPLPNKPLDVYGVLRSIDPEVFGTSYRAFSGRYGVWRKFGNGPRAFWTITGYQRQDEFSERLHSVAHVVRTDDVLDLPPAHHVVREFELVGQARRIYGEMEAQMVAEISAGEHVVAANALVKLLRLRQITSGHLDGQQVHDLRLNLFEGVLDELGGEPVVVFAQFTSDLLGIESVAAELGLTYGEISGRRNNYEEWGEGDVNVLGVQLQAGAEGIDLTRSRYAVFYSNTFSLSNYEQSLARLRRPGQAHPVIYTHLIAAGTVDERVLEALQQKKDVVDSIVHNMRRT